MPGDLNQLAADTVAALSEAGLTVATAEATTGGLIGYLLTEIPGSSAVFRAGIAPYSNSTKMPILSPDVLRDHGAVSRQAAEELARFVRWWAPAAIGLAETGIVGPTGGSPERPIGLFWISVATATGVTSERLVFDGDRSANRKSCAAAALRMLIERARWP